MARTDGAPAFTKKVLLNQVRIGNYIKVEGRWSKVRAIRYDRYHFHFKTDHPDYVHDDFSVKRGTKINIMCWLTASHWESKQDG